ncbi:FAD-dependent oxidoreductase [Microbacterium radiodurans]|uniref:FAD-dependent oxidoreductase n=1 Tax=Microbacterium radiodurans TaxID=661398 RepID=A0A5J5INF6_9MICO|nr:FAD-dependent oxidoreductase [Microbacterium radiodurans]KAA9084956.1 FAD-dependent oxidoreductase [Microbacterium radiodurans]
MESLWKQDAAGPAGSPFEAGRRHDVVVIGAGLTGLATALELVRSGMDVAIVERGGVGELASGSNTGKISLLQGTTLGTLREHHPASLVRAYVDANRDGFDWITRAADELGVPTTVRTAVTYAQERDGVDAVSAEFDAARQAGLPVRLADRDELSAAAVPACGAVLLEGQRAVDPMRLLVALAEAFAAAGGSLYLGANVTGVHVFPRPRVETEQGPLRAGRIVLATGTPILDRGLYFAKVSGMRSACVAFELAGEVPDDMYLSADAPTRSIRTVRAGDGAGAGDRIIVGGAGHPVGRGGSERGRVDDLVAWARENLPVGAETHRWSAQDYTSHNLVPFIGALPRSLGRVRFATGYAKWGLTNAPAAALRIASELRGEKMRDRPKWMTTIGTRLTVPADLARGAAENAKVGAAAARGWAAATARPTPVRQPAEGQGEIAQRHGMPVGVATVDGRTRAVSAVCPHLGGVLEWNDLECTWDCPLHASRFTADGDRIEGPAARGLRRLS